MKKRTSNIVVGILAGIGLLLAIPLAVNIYRSSNDPYKDLARENGISNYYEVNGELRDKVELTPAFQRVQAEVNAAVEKELDDKRIFGMGRFYQGGQIKKRILRERYGIDWRPESEMNPWKCID